MTDPARGRPGPSLKARAIGYLSRREHSRLELRRKLSAYSDDPAEIESVLDDLQRGNWQSDTRYAQSYVHRKSSAQGVVRIMQSLRQQGVADSDLAVLRDQLQGTECDRARSVWQRRFGALPADARGYAHQYRFLASRGFSTDCIRRILGGRENSDSLE